MAVVRLAAAHHARVQRDQLAAVLRRVAVPAVSAVPAGTLDLAGALDRLDRDQALLDEVLREFAASLPATLEAIEASLAGGDGGAAARTAHSLKGAARQVGADRLAEAAAALEHAAGEGSTADLAALLDELGALGRDVRQAIDVRLEA